MSDSLSTGTVVNPNSGYCSYRLPCGFCRLTMTNCPICSSTITPTWMPEITCTSSTDGTATVHIPKMDGVTACINSEVSDAGRNNINS